MKKTNTKDQVRKITTENKHLIEGAKLLIREVKTPAALLEFMLEGLWWIEQFDNKYKLETDNFNSRLIIENIVQPWFAGGDDIVVEIAKGLRQIQGSIGSGYYEEYLSKLVQAFGVSLKEGIYLDTEKYLLTLNALIELSFSIRDYEDDRNKEIEQNKLSKAA